ncbi:MAG: hypothetical protein M3R12_11775 [Actinomycetota bacterium]|nr:hypothetical protein [Actinomycetota bacterium]
MIRRDGGGLRRLTRADEVVAMPAWRGDGRVLVHWANPTLELEEIDYTNNARVTADPADVERRLTDRRDAAALRGRSGLLAK